LNGARARDSVPQVRPHLTPMHLSSRHARSERRLHSSGTPPLQRRELALVVALSLCLIWTTWSIGGVSLWAEAGTCLFALAAAFIAFVPSQATGWSNLRALIRFVPFWLGAFVLLYMVVQDLNASSKLIRFPDGSVTGRTLPHLSWLPSGVETPITSVGPLRMALIFLPCWIVGCAVWCGSYRPKAMRAMLWVMALNASLFAVIGVLQEVTKAKSVLWLFDKPISNMPFWGTVANPNHASAFMNIGLGAALTLFLYYTGKQGRDFTKGGSFLMLVPLSVLLLMGILNAMSRAGVVVAVLIVGAFLTILTWRLFCHLREERNTPVLVVSSIVMLLIAGIAGTSVKNMVSMDRLYSELRSLVSVANAPEDDIRFYISLASRDMIEDRPAYGWGAGCYRYFFQKYQKNYPALMPKNMRYRINYAHNDFLNCLCDLGFVGATPLFSVMIGLPAFVFFFRRQGLDGPAMMGLATTGAILLHATLEFFLQHPLVSLEYVLFLAALTRMISLRHFQNKLAYPIGQPVR